MLRQMNDLAENKLILLYFLFKMDFPLTNTQITRCVMENTLINYFDLQQYLNDLFNSKLIEYFDNKSKHFYALTELGKSTLDSFHKRISASLCDIIDQYVEKNKAIVRSETQVISKYEKVKEKEYIVNCKVIENDIILIDITLNVVSSKQARQICNNWGAKATLIYKNLIDNLI